MKFTLHKKVKYMVLGALIALAGFMLGSVTKGIEAQSEEDRFDVIDGTLFVTKGIFVGDVAKQSGILITSEGGGSVGIMHEGNIINIMGVTPEGHSVTTLRSRDGKGGIVLKVPTNSDGMVSTIDKYGKEYDLKPESVNDGTKAQPKSEAVDSLIVRDLHVLDSISVGGTKKTPSINLRDTVNGGEIMIHAKKPREAAAVIGFGENGGGSLFLTPDKGKGGVGLVVDEGGNGSLIIKANNGRGGVGLSMSNGEGMVSILSKQGSTKVIAGVDEGAGYVIIGDKFGDASRLD